MMPPPSPTGGGAGKRKPFRSISQVLDTPVTPELLAALPAPVQQTNLMMGPKAAQADAPPDPELVRAAMAAFTDEAAILVCSEQQRVLDIFQQLVSQLPMRVKCRSAIGTRGLIAELNTAAKDIVEGTGQQFDLVLCDPEIVKQDGQLVVTVHSKYSVPIALFSSTPEAIHTHVVDDWLAGPAQGAVDPIHLAALIIKWSAKSNGKPIPKLHADGGPSPVSPHQEPHHHPPGMSPTSSGQYQQHQMGQMSQYPSGMGSGMNGSASQNQLGNLSGMQYQQQSQHMQDNSGGGSSWNKGNMQGVGAAQQQPTPSSSISTSTPQSGQMGITPYSMSMSGMGLHQPSSPYGWAASSPMSNGISSQTNQSGQMTGQIPSSFPPSSPSSSQSQQPGPSMAMSMPHQLAGMAQSGLPQPGQYQQQMFGGNQFGSSSANSSAQTGASPGFEPLLSMLMNEAEGLRAQLAKLKKDRQEANAASTSAANSYKGGVPTDENVKAISSLEGCELGIKLLAEIEDLKKQQRRLKDAAEAQRKAAEAAAKAAREAEERKKAAAKAEEERLAREKKAEEEAVRMELERRRAAEARILNLSPAQRRQNAFNLEAHPILLDD